MGNAKTFMRRMSNNSFYAFFMLVPVQVHIGKLIRAKLYEQGRSVTWLARQIPCTRNNMYKIFRKSNLDTILLQHISQVLDYNFFDDYFKK